MNLKTKIISSESHLLGVKPLFVLALDVIEISNRLGVLVEHGLQDKAVFELVVQTELEEVAKSAEVCNGQVVVEKILAS